MSAENLRLVSWSGHRLPRGGLYCLSLGLKDVVGEDLGLFGGQAHTGFEDAVKGLQNGFERGSTIASMYRFYLIFQI